MTHYAEIHASIVTKASNKTSGFAVGGPSHHRRRLGHRSSVNVRKDDCDLISPAVCKLLDFLKCIRRGKKEKRSRRHQLKCHSNVPTTHSRVQGADVRLKPSSMTDSFLRGFLRD